MIGLAASPGLALLRRNRPVLTGIVARRKIDRQNKRTNPTSRSAPCPHSSPLSLPCCPRTCRARPDPACGRRRRPAPFHRAVAALGRFRNARSELRRIRRSPRSRPLRGRLDVLIVDYNLGRGMTGTEVAEEFARLLGHAVPTVMLTGDPANAEVPWLADAPVWVARKPLLPGDLVGRAAAAGRFPPRSSRPSRLTSRRRRLPQLAPARTAATRAADSSRCPLMRSFGAGCVLRNFGGLPPLWALSILFHSVTAARGS